MLKHRTAFRSIDGSGTWEEWLVPARLLDTTHRFDTAQVKRMLRDIQNDPPTLPQPDEITNTDVINALAEEITDHSEEAD